MEKSIYSCIDLKSFYASVEAAERKLDPFKENLVVADPSRGRGAICLAVTPAMKSLGIKNRCRLFEIPETVTYITAKPRMKLYMEYSARIYSAKKISMSILLTNAFWISHLICIRMEKLRKKWRSC